MRRRWPAMLATLGGAAALVALVADAGAARGAASQTWPAFVVVAGLLLIGLVAAADGLFAYAGEKLAAAAPGGTALFCGFAALVLIVTAVLNLDTSVAFLSPVAVHTSRRRGDDGFLLLAACILLSNAGSLLLPGSNLTNLIVLGHLHLSGGRFAGRMWLPWILSGLMTAAVAGVMGRRSLRRGAAAAGAASGRPVVGIGLVAVVAAVALVVSVASPAPWVLATGLVAVGWRMVQRRVTRSQVAAVLGVPVLVGLFGLSVALGALGRDWTGPAHALAHLDPWATAFVGGAATVVINNLPAAALLSARPPTHPLSLLVGLNLGPNLFVSGSLAWVLWYNAARATGGRPDVRRAVKVGVVAAPLSMAAAVAALTVLGAHT